MANTCIVPTLILSRSICFMNCSVQTFATEVRTNEELFTSSGPNLPSNLESIFPKSKSSVASLEFPILNFFRQLISPNKDVLYYRLSSDMSWRLGFTNGASRASSLIRTDCRICPRHYLRNVVITAVSSCPCASVWPYVHTWIEVATNGPPGNI